MSSVGVFLFKLMARTGVLMAARKATNAKVLILVWEAGFRVVLKFNYNSPG